MNVSRHLSISGPDPMLVFLLQTTLAGIKSLLLVENGHVTWSSQSECSNSSIESIEDLRSGPGT